MNPFDNESLIFVPCFAVFQQANVLCEYIDERKTLFEGKTVLELGSGTGLVGLCAYHCGMCTHYYSLCLNGIALKLSLYIILLRFTSHSLRSWSITRDFISKCWTEHSHWSARLLWSTKWSLSSWYLVSTPTPSGSVRLGRQLQQIVRKALGYCIGIWYHLCGGDIWSSIENNETTPYSKYYTIMQN